MVVYQTEEYRSGLPWVFFIIFTPKIYARIILVIMISIYTRESMMMATRISKVGQLRLKLWLFVKPQT